MLAGAAMIFFAYIGFDSVSTHSEEAKNPQRDVPIGIIASLVLCTILYIAVAGRADRHGPLRPDQHRRPRLRRLRAGRPELGAGYLISLGALTGITSVLLVMMLSQPRVLLAMARDGLVPPSFFGAIHEKFRTPWKSTILTGVFVGLMGAFLPLRHPGRAGQHRHPAGLRDRLRGGADHAEDQPRRRTGRSASRSSRSIPILGILICLMLMFSLPWQNWVRLVVWLAIGFVIYFGYGYRHSVLARMPEGGYVPEAERV